jgi:hypothetical protein
MPLPSRGERIVRPAIFLALAALAVTAWPIGAQPAIPTPVPATGPTCGVEADSVAQIRAAVAADARFKRDGGDAGREFYSSEALQAIWTFTTAKNPAYPAALCEQVVESEGAMRIQRQLHCEAKQTACAAMAAAISQQDDGSGDGE